MFPIKNQTHSRRRGLSLVEVMIAMVMTLIVLGAMMAAFGYGSREMQKGRASIELNNRLITAEEQLRRDLDRITVELKPYHQLPGTPSGYVEIIDGPSVDGATLAASVVTTLGGVTPGSTGSVFGDLDDYISFTVRSDGRPFRGRLNNTIIESHLAEIVWMVLPDTTTIADDDFVLIRRQLLILPASNTVGTANDTGELAEFLAQNDISVRLSGADLVANSLADLAIRGNRFAHSTATSPGASLLNQALLTTMYNVNNFNENHVISSSLAAFDIQVFAPDASVRAITGGGAITDVLEPSDIGSRNGIGSASVISGAYLDLGNGDTAGTPGVLGSTAAGGYVNGVYDTGTSFYNRIGANNRGSNAVDDPPLSGGAADGVADDVGEQLARAPYNAPIRGLKFTMRAIEPNSKQVRQLTVTKSFVPES